MRIVRETKPAGRLTYSAIPEKYDGVPPITRFSMDHGPLVLNQEREAVACFLLFGQWTGGALKLPQPVGPATATAIERAAHPIPVRPETIAYDPKALALGEGTMVVQLGAPATQTQATTLWILRSDVWTGSLRTHRGIAVASNYFAFRTPDDPGAARACLAMSVLFAEDLGCDRVITPGVSAGPVEKWRELFAVTRLQLIEEEAR